MGLRVQALAFVPGMSVSQATGAMVGNALGSNDPDRARAVTRASVLLCTAVMAVLAITIVLLAYPIVAIFDVQAGSHLEALTVEWMRLLGYGMPIVGPHIAFVGCLQGSGSTYSSLSINLLGTGVQIPLSIILGFSLGWGVTGIWIAFPMSFVIKAIHGFVLYRRGRWARSGVSLAPA
jgi:Na+-driven multidrug efflux pump